MNSSLRSARETLAECVECHAGGCVSREQSAAIGVDAEYALRVVQFHAGGEDDDVAKRAGQTAAALHAAVDQLLGADADADDAALAERIRLLVEDGRRVAADLSDDGARTLADGPRSTDPDDAPERERDDGAGRVPLGERSADALLAQPLEQLFHPAGTSRREPLRLG